MFTELSTCFLYYESERGQEKKAGFQMCSRGFTVPKKRVNMHRERCLVDMKYGATEAGWETRT